MHRTYHVTNIRKCMWIWRNNAKNTSLDYYGTT